MNELTHRFSVAPMTDWSESLSLSIVEGGVRTTCAPGDPEESDVQRISWQKKAPLSRSFGLTDDRIWPETASPSHNSWMSSTHIKKLSAGDTELARSLFSVMASAFGENTGSVSTEYAASLLIRDDVWVVAALVDGEPVAGLPAFVLPLTRSESAELFIYDIAVVPTHQRHGIGRRLVEEVRKLASERGIATAWVPAENEDVHALEFYRSMDGAPSAVTIFTFSQ